VDAQGREGIVACISRSLNVHEARYTAWKGELLAVVWAVKHFKAYLAGRDFTVVTDHRPAALADDHSGPVGAAGEVGAVSAGVQLLSAAQGRSGEPSGCAQQVPSHVDCGPNRARLDEEGQFKRVLPKVRFATEELRQKAIQEFIDGTSVETVAGVAAALTVGDGWDSAQTEVARAVAACRCVGWVSGAVPAVSGRRPAADTDGLRLGGPGGASRGAGS
jgi:hypothetical protein